MKQAALICVTRNNAEKLQATLNSIIQNTNPANYDLFIIDNASCDSTLGIYQQKLAEHITIFRSGKNLHWVGGINLGIEMTKGYNYVGFLKDDIEVAPRWLEHLINILEGYNTVGAVGPLSSSSHDWQGYDRFRLGPAKPGLPELEGIDRQDVVQMAQKTGKICFSIAML